MNWRPNFRQSSIIVQCNSKPTDTKGGELVILEFKRMSCVTDQYVKRAKQVAEAQYKPLKAALQKTLGLQGWTVTQKSFRKAS